VADLAAGTGIVFVVVPTGTVARFGIGIPSSASRTVRQGFCGSNNDKGPSAFNRSILVFKVGRSGRPVLLSDVVPLPIATGHPLIHQQCIQRVGGTRKRPLDAEVGAESHDDDPCPFLRHSGVGCIERTEDQVVVQTLVAALRLVPLQT
jgi:hypothetical protein